MSVLNDVGAPLFGEEAKTRKSATHGEAGYARAARDAYFTLPWMTRALLGAFDEFHFGSPVWEPACGAGYIADVLLDHGMGVLFSDIHDYDYESKHLQKIDFLRDPIPLNSVGDSLEIQAVITNPPFDLARPFVRRALDVVKPHQGKVAILQRHDFDAPKSNRPLFTHPFAQKLILPRRPEWPIWNEEKRCAEIPLGPDGKRIGPRFPYAWYIWDWRHEGPPIIRWIDEVPA
jgi:hypothetical protein